jgi:hypothetical protein
MCRHSAAKETRLVRMVMGDHVFTVALYLLDLTIL